MSPKPTVLDLKTLLPAVENIARDAGAEIMRFYAAGAKVYTKTDGSTVTDADLAAEKIILPRLAALTPNIPIVSEEAFERGVVPDVSGGTFWTVDPLDGTKEFTDRTGAFVVALSLVVDGKPALGVIYHPAFDLLYVGAGPGSAEKVLPDGTRERLKATTLLDANVRVLVNAHSADMVFMKGYLTDEFGKAVTIDPTPGILRACQVAENTADASVIYPQHRGGRTKWWDVAPGHAIVEAAGGKVSAPDGSDIRYDAPDYQVGPVISVSANYLLRNTPAANDAVYKPRKFK